MYIYNHISGKAAASKGSLSVCNITKSYKIKLGGKLESTTCFWLQHHPASRGSNTHTEWDFCSECWQMLSAYNSNRPTNVQTPICWCDPIAPWHHCKGICSTWSYSSCTVKSTTGCKASLYQFARSEKPWLIDWGLPPKLINNDKYTISPASIWYEIILYNWF